MPSKHDKRVYQLQINNSMGEFRRREGRQRRWRRKGGGEGGAEVAVPQMARGSQTEHAWCIKHDAGVDEMEMSSSRSQHCCREERRRRCAGKGGKATARAGGSATNVRLF